MRVASFHFTDSIDLSVVLAVVWLGIVLSGKWFGSIEPEIILTLLICVVL